MLTAKQIEDDDGQDIYLICKNGISIARFVVLTEPRIGFCLIADNGKCQLRVTSYSYSDPWNENCISLSEKIFYLTLATKYSYPRSMGHLISAFGMSKKLLFLSKMHYKPKYADMIRILYHNTLIKNYKKMKFKNVKIMI